MPKLRAEDEIIQNWQGDIAQPIVSIICVTFNHEKYIEDAIIGFLIQETKFPFEILIHDDASTDKTTDIVKKYERLCPSLIKLIYQSENQFSKGNKPGQILKKLAKGKYIALCEGDDYWTDPRKLQKQVDLLETNPKCAGCFHETQLIYENGKHGKIYGQDSASILTTEDTITTLSPFHTSSFLYLNSAFKAPNWMNRIISVDMALFSIVSASGNLIKIPETMSVYRKNEQGVTNTAKVKNNYHKHRIELISYLNEFHAFKYNKKAQQVISFHLHEINKLRSENIGDLPSNNFIEPHLSSENVDTYYIRATIYLKLKAFITSCYGVLLDVGCGQMPYRELVLQQSAINKYIGLDIENPIYQSKNKPDLFWDGKKIPLPGNSTDCAMATELFEHLPEPEQVMSEICRVLKPGGKVFFTVPFLWPLHDMPHDEYRYTPISLKRHLENAGFNKIDIKALGGWDASLAQMLGLWLKRRPMSTQDQKNFTQILYPFYLDLISLASEAKDLTFDEMCQQNVMITGLYGTAMKPITT